MELVPKSEVKDLRKIDFWKSLEELKQDEVLKEAFYNLMHSNESANLPYHGNQHSLAVGLLMFETFKTFNPIVRRVATFAGLLHDFNHSGQPDSKMPNIEKAIGAAKIYSPEDLFEMVIEVIKATEYPYKNSPVLEGEDLGQALNLMKLAIRLSDLSWQNLFPVDVASLGIHKEQYSSLAYSEIEKGTKDFRQAEMLKFESLDTTCPAVLKSLYNLFKSR